jgi:dTDP-4-dehydrorhamnose reductase/dTDP-4-dehydrorhamnose 3,5-epimerase
MTEIQDSIEFKKTLEAHTTPIPGLVYYDLTVNPDRRGWFKENWNREKMVALGLPDFGPVQNNVSFNSERGVTRGLHAEPWDKYVSLNKGKIFGAWVDLREGETFGEKFTLEMDPSMAIFVPRGVGNGFQVLEDDTVYSYLVNDHWSLEAKSEYTFLNLADTTTAIDWPLPLNPELMSEDDVHHPLFKDVTPMRAKKTLVTGANGQLGRALKNMFPDAEFATHEDLDLTSDDLESARSWRQYDTIINAGAYTKVDLAETQEGRVDAWKLNAHAIAELGKIATKYRVTIVNISSDYVYDGLISPHNESEPVSPLGVYGQTKAAGDAIVETVPKHYTVRTSWVVGDGNNFVRTMQKLAANGISPGGIYDQVGRLTFADDIAKGIKHLLDTQAEYGTYNLTNEGESTNWAEIAKIVFEASGRSADDVTPVTTEEYFKGKEFISPRPLQSMLSLDKLEATGFTPRNWREALNEYLRR